MSNDAAGLDRRYRLLLHAYPRAYRRDRGEEILDTLLAAAPPSRRFPAMRETFNLLRGGMRCRLGRPRSRMIVVVAALAVIVGAFLGASAASWLGWQTARALPDSAQTAGISRLIGDAPTNLTRHDELFYYPYTGPDTPLFGEDDYNAGEISWGYQVNVTPANFPAIAAAARDRLAAAGWQVSGVIPQQEGTMPEARFLASKDGLTLTYSVQPDTTPPGPQVSLERAEPWPVWPLTALGILLGGLAGWLFAGWVSRRTQTRGWFIQALTLSTAAVSIALTLLFVAIIVSSQLTMWTDPATWTPAFRPFALWTLFMVFPFRLPLLIDLAAILATAALAALPHRSRRRTADAARA
ncbi:hypothetical protein [Fodinicola acaciae]|uniref:hypothetical protein n=1 Tax=Fodinicola acaciae TaxID=2681555 RepID=UPI0013D22CA6|nr:hypothetical protein [Fodinicola acaciae]